MALLADMTMLSSVTPFMDFPWALILNGAMSGIGFYAIRIVLLTVALKIILFPLDLFQRYKMRKNQLITVRIKPQLEKLEKAYGNDPKVLQQKQAELNKREGMSVFSSCLPMIVTLVVFIWLWSALQTTANYKQFDNYTRIYDVYTSAYQTEIGEGFYDATVGGISDEYGSDFRVSYDEAFLTAYGQNPDVAVASATALNSAVSSATASSTASYFTLYAETYSQWFAKGFETNLGTYDASKAVELASESGENNARVVAEQYCRTVAQNDVYDYYYNEGDYADGKGYKRDGFLWIKDIWMADTPWANSLAPTQAEFETAIGEYGTNPDRSGYDEAELERMVDAYETVMARVIAEGEYGVNGLLILPVLAVLLSVLSQIITRGQQKKSGQDSMTGNQNAGCMKAMIFVMPVLMGYFAIQYCAAFTLYMVTNSTMSLLINLITSSISKKMIPIDESTVGSKKIEEIVARYGRPDPNAKK